MSDGEERPERRAHPRYQFPRKVEFLMPDGTAHQGMIHNISLGGLLLESSTRLPLESVIQIRLTSDPAGMIEGRVIRAATAGKIGIAFVQMSSAQIALLRATIERLAQEANG